MKKVVCVCEEEWVCVWQEEGDETARYVWRLLQHLLHVHMLQHNKHHCNTWDETARYMWRLYIFRAGENNRAWKKHAGGNEKKQTFPNSPKNIINCEKKVSFSRKISPMSKKNNRMFSRVFPFFDQNFFSKKLLESARGPHWYPLITPKTSFEPIKPGWATANPKPWTPGSTWFFS